MTKTLLGILREYKKGSILTILLSILEAAFEILIPLRMADLIDQGIEPGEMAAVWKLGTIILVFAVLQLLTGVLSAHVAAKTSVGFSANLRQDMYDNVQTFSFSNIDKFSTASIVTRLTTDVTNIQNAYQMLIRMAVRGPVMLVFSMIVSFRINTTIALIFLAVIPIMALLLLLIIRKVGPFFNRVFRTYDTLNNVVQENVRGIRVVKSFNQEDHEIKKFKGISQSIYEDFAAGERLLAFNSPIMQFFMYACMILISWIGAKAIVASGNSAALGMTTGDLTALFSYATQILMALMMLSMVFTMITISLASARRIAEVLEEKTDIANPTGAEMTVRDGSIRFEQVSFAYAAKADKKVLSDIDLSIASGQTVGIIGGTGSGKTTMLNALSAFIGYNERVVTIEDTRELQLKQRIVIPRVACPPNSEGKGEFTMHELLVGALRERPDRIVVGECRDDETYEMLQAMQTGHDGSLTTIHANDCAGAFTRIENMILKSQGNMTMEAIRRQIGAAIDVVVQVKRWRGGYRRIESITAVEGFSDGNVTRNELFHWEGSPENGRHVATGYQPARLKEKILDADAEYDPRWFEGGVW